MSWFKKTHQKPKYKNKTNLDGRTGVKYNYVGARTGLSAEPLTSNNGHRLVGGVLCPISQLGHQKMNGHRKLMMSVMKPFSQAVCSPKVTGMLTFTEKCVPYILNNYFCLLSEQYI